MNRRSSERTTQSLMRSPRPVLLVLALGAVHPLPRRARAVALRQWMLRWRPRWTRLMPTKMSRWQLPVTYRPWLISIVRASDDQRFFRTTSRSTLVLRTSRIPFSASRKGWRANWQRPKLRPPLLPKKMMLMRSPTNQFVGD